jgi:hypothetical protein
MALGMLVMWTDDEPPERCFARSDGARTSYIAGPFSCAPNLPNSASSVNSGFAVK